MSEKLKSLYLKALELKPVLPGSISEQYNVCGKANCRCKDDVNPRKHGPQPKLGFTLDGKNSTLVIRKSDKDIALLMNENFQDLRRLQAEINDETLRIYKEMGGEDAYAQIERALSEVRSKVSGASSDTATLRHLKESRDKWKEKAKARNARIQKDSVRIRDLSASRDEWKKKATSLKVEREACERQVAELKRGKEGCEATVAELELQLKKLRS